MLPVLDNSARVSVFDLSPHDFDNHVVDLGWPRYRAQQIRQWVYQKSVASFERMTNLSVRDRLKLAEHVQIGGGVVTRRQNSEDGTIKLLLHWPNGSVAETVMIPDGMRYTACVSSQVGCPVGCKFCASGMAGVKGNLTAGQIVEQVFHLNHALAERGQRISNIVFMGMGEPLANYNNVMSAIRILHDPQAFNLGARKITVSTVGVPQRIRSLADEELALNLAISLHAPTEELRRRLIPWAEHFAIDEILDAARYYFQKTGREITLEYILLSGVNDQPEQAHQLVPLCRTLRANVNLIRYNEVAGLEFKRPVAEDVVRFQQILRAGGVNAHVRKSRGRDIDAACGQLRRKTEAQQAAASGATEQTAATEITAPTE